MISQFLEAHTEEKLATVFASLYSQMKRKHIVTGHIPITRHYKFVTEQ
jgi:hypothetical protein